MARVTREDQQHEEHETEHEQKRDLERDEAAATTVAAKVESSEVIEPIRVTETGKPRTQLRDVVFTNTSGRDVFINMPDRMKVPAGKSFRVPCEPDAPNHEATVGYHRSIHRQAPQLRCEFGNDCSVLQHVRSVSEAVSNAMPVREARPGAE